MKIITYTLSTALIATSLSMATTSAFANEDRFVCDAIGDGNFVVTFPENGSDEAFASYALDGQAPTSLPTRLVPAQSGSGFRYVGPGIEFHGKGNAGLLTDTGVGETVPCRFETASTGGNNAGNTQNLNIPALSLGGKIRSGPGLNFPQVGSIRGTKPITIVRNTGVRMDGYDWFEIRQANGAIGYQWGGIMCSPNQQLTGIYERCN